MQIVFQTVGEKQNKYLNGVELFENFNKLKQTQNQIPDGLKIKCKQQKYTLEKIRITFV